MLNSIIGALVILAGAIIPASAVIDALRSRPADPVLQEQLLLGAMLLKGGLVVLGLIIVVLGRWPIKRVVVRDETPAHSRVDICVLGFILVVASALYLYRLGEGLWYDEIVTYVNYVQAPLGEIISTYDDQNQHLLYSLLAHISFDLFGEGAWSLRLPAVIFGLGSIWALYLLGRELTGSREALLSAALLAFSYHQVWFSQNARGYTGLLFWTLLSSWLFVRALREGDRKLWVLYAIAVALGAYTLIYMFFAVLGHVAIYLVSLLARRTEQRPGRWEGLIVGFSLAGFLTFLLYALVVPQFIGAFSEAQVLGRSWTDPVWALLEFVKGMRVNFSGSLVAIAALVVFCAGLLSYARTNRTLLYLLFVPSVSCLILKWAAGHHLWPRSFYFIIGFGILVVVRGAMEMGRFAIRLLRVSAARAVPAGVALTIGLILFSSLSIPFAYGPKQDFQAAKAFVEQSMEPGDAIVTVGLASLPYKSFYRQDWNDAETLESIKGISSHAKRTWLLYTLPIQLQDASPEILDSIENDFTEVKRFYGTLQGGAIFVCRLDGRGSETSSLR
jgi:hypothetical protein